MHCLKTGWGIVCGALLCGCALGSDQNIVLGCETFRYEIAPDGRNQAFVDLASGRNFLKPTPGERAYCAAITKEGQSYTPTAAVFENDTLRLDFGDAGVKATVRVINERNRLIIDVEDVSGEPDSLTFLNVLLQLEALPSEPFAACALSLTLHTRVDRLPALQNDLRASCCQRFGFKGARAALIGVPQEQILPVIRQVVRAAAPVLPFSDQGGAWALESREGYGSYLMNFGTLTEQSVDNWIAMCQRMGANQIDNHGGGFFKFGCFDLDPKKFPDGWESFKRIIARLHEAGISSIFHTYTCYINKNSRYVTPVPHPDLDLLESFTLAASVDDKAAEIVVKEPTTNVSLKTGYMETSNRTLRIGDEIIGFEGVTREAPYTFTGCKRGFHNTHAAAHQAGQRAGILKTFWNGLYIPAPDSALFDEIAHRTAEIVDQCGFDGIYFDAIEGLQYMWGKENYWYYGDKFVLEVMRKLKKPVGLEYAGMVHKWWHYRSRYQAWDMASRGYKRFMDTRIAAMKSGQEYQHGSWGGYWPDVERFAPTRDYGLFLPLQLGWWRFNVWSSPKRDAMFLDDMEYVCCKLLGNNAGFSMLTSVDEALMEKHPIYKDFTEMLRTYEGLRQEGYFSPVVLKPLREPGKEFTLFKEGNGKWNFKPVFYRQHKVEGIADSTASWRVVNEYAAQPVKLRLEALMGATPYGDPENTVITDARDAEEFMVQSAPGVDVRLTRSAESVLPTGEETLELRALSLGDAKPRESWALLSRGFKQPLNLKGKNALGLWIKGDGSSALLDIRLLSYGATFARKLSSHYVKLDFLGWRYFNLIEPESSRITDYKWPVNTRYYVYDNHMGIADFASIDEVQIGVNNLAANQECRCLIGPVKALGLVEAPIESPELTINGQSARFPVAMKPGMYLELSPAGECKLFAPDTKLVREIKLEGGVPTLRTGGNDLSFGAAKADGARARVTVSATGHPILANQGEQPDTLFISHRGESYDMPENTMAAFRAAVERGADGFELDVYLTKDKELVCLHDRTTKRVTGVELQPGESTLAELRALDAGVWKGERFKGERLPTLAEALTLVRDNFLVYVEIKSGVETVPYVKQLIDSLPAVTPERVLFICFNRDVVSALRKQLPTYRTYWLTGYKVDARGQLEPSAEKIIEVLKKTGAQGVDAHANPALSAQHIAAIKKAGFSYHVWTVDDPDRAADLVLMGVDSITSNRGAYLTKTFCHKNGE